MTSTYEKNLNVADNVVTVGTTVPAVVPDAVDYEALWAEQREENARLKAVMTAARIEGKPTHAPGSDRKPAVSAEHIKRSLGALALHGMSRDQKLQSLGVDPASVSDAALRKLFGRGTDGVAAKDLSLTNKLQYRTLREAAILLNIYGA